MATSKVLKPRRGSTTEHATFKGQAFEITFDTDKKTIVAHDGLTMGGFPLAHEASVSETDAALRTLIDQKVSEVEGVSSSELKALETSLRGLINNNAQQQAVRDDNQDSVIAVLDSAHRELIANAQSSADAANQGLVGVVRTVNGESADATGTVNVPLMPDYSAGVIIASGWVASYNCIGYAEVSWLDNMNAVVTVNGIRVYSQRGAVNFSPVGTQWIVPKGATVTFTGSFEVLPRVFPLKGV